MSLTKIALLKHGIAIKKTAQFLCKPFKENKKEYFENINVKDINDNKKFWKTIKPFFNNKGLKTNVTKQRNVKNLLN